MPATPNRQQANPQRLIYLVAALLALQPLTTDLYLPGLAALQDELHSRGEQVRYSLTSLLLTFGLSQLLWGKLALKVPRAAILYLGLGLHAVAAIGGSLATDIDWLIITRAVQGAGLGAVIIAARAMMHGYHPANSTDQLARSLGLVALVATLTIPLGALLVTAAGWRAAVLAPALLSAGVLLWLVNGKPEAGLHSAPERPVALAKILRQPVFYRYTLLNSLTYATLVGLLSNAPLIFISHQHVSPVWFGLVMCVMVMGFAAGTRLCRWLLQSKSLRQTLLVASALNLVAAVLLASLVLFSWLTLITFLLPGLLFMLAHGINHSCAQSQVLKPFDGHSLQVSAFNGSLMMLATFAISSALPGITDAGTQLLACLAGLMMTTAVASLWAARSSR
ncbi:MFS transporter [Oceanobacter mangrovi]|uniref:MFS transporter n=1 Tax=Oceanobacter mangrovi TaxID=2862510 RepID=UPI001C8D2416|nr:MFS transporter [Oceanobacter mangrovi]